MIGFGLRPDPLNGNSNVSSLGRFFVLINGTGRGLAIALVGFKS